jgi:Ca2+-binding EF-hand superfamily protein
LVRSLNQTPTEAELAEWSKVVDRDNKGKFEFADFLALMAK